MGQGSFGGLSGNKAAAVRRALRRAHRIAQQQQAQLAAQQVTIASQNTAIAAAQDAANAATASQTSLTTLQATVTALQTRIATLEALPPRNTLTHGWVRTGVVVSSANATVTLDTTLAGTFEFWIGGIFIHQLTAGTISIGVGMINIGTNATSYDNIVAASQPIIAGFSAIDGLRFGVLPSKLQKVAPNTPIVVKTSSISLGSATLAIDILGVYR